MLLLTRRPTESIIITTPDGTEIVVSLLGIKQNQVKVGIEAPTDVAIVREEIANREPPRNLPAA